jgi:hypothetical protein
MNTAIALLLQAATTILLSIGQNNSLPVATKMNAINIVEHSIQIATQAEAMNDIHFQIPKNNGIWPSALDLKQTAYRGTNGFWAPISNNLSIVGETISFGDINNDGFDDAAVVMKQINPDKSANYFLALMLNQGNILFNIANIQLGSSVQIFGHKITNNKILYDMKIGNSAKKVYNYELLGNQVITL